MLTKPEADDWVFEIILNGTGIEKERYKKKWGIGSIAERLWDQPGFTLGVEYGILIAMDKIFEIHKFDYQD